MEAQAFLFSQPNPSISYRLLSPIHVLITSVDNIVLCHREFHLLPPEYGHRLLAFLMEFVSAYNQKIFFKVFIDLLVILYWIFMSVTNALVCQYVL